MSRSHAFEAVWPPATDDDFDSFPEVRKARRMFETQMTGLADLVGQAVRSPSGRKTDDLAREIAILLHNIAGTATYFDEGDFGVFASEIEQPVQAAFTADLLRPLCARIEARLELRGIG